MTVCTNAAFTAAFHNMTKAGGYDGRSYPFDVEQHLHALGNPCIIGRATFPTHSAGFWLTGAVENLVIIALLLALFFVFVLPWDHRLEEGASNAQDA